jgi:hypothetical protein
MVTPGVVPQDCPTVQPGTVPVPRTGSASIVVVGAGMAVLDVDGGVVVVGAMELVEAAAGGTS